MQETNTAAAVAVAHQACTCYTLQQFVHVSLMQNDRNVHEIITHSYQ